jgi:hypothetical protein
MNLTLQEKIKNDLIQALKDRNEIKKSTLRTLQSSIKNKEIEFGRKLSDQEIGQIVTKEIKQRKDSIVEFEKGSRDELAQKEKEEIAVLEIYQPAQLSDQDIEKLVKQTISQLSATSPQDIGKVMSKLMPIISGKADGSKVSMMVKKHLNQP